MDEDNLALYLASLPPPLTVEKERELLDMGEAGRKELIDCSLRLVVWFARQYQGRGVELLDLVQEGNLCLIGAVEKCPHDWRGRLSTWLKICLRRAMLRAIMDHAPMLHVPVHQQERLRELRNRNIDDLAAAERAEERILQRAVGRLVDIDQPLLTTHDHHISLADSLVDDAEMVEDEVAEQDTACRLHSAMNALPPQWRCILWRRYWHDEAYPEIGDRVGLSAELVRRRHVLALSRLREMATVYSYR